MADIVTSLWFGPQASEAVSFYTSFLPDSTVVREIRAAAEGPGGPEGTLIQIDFTLLGRPFSAIGSARDVPFTDAVSLTVTTQTQEEADEYWDKLTDGGSEVACGWCIDRFGLRWQICPQPVLDLLGHADPQVARRATQAMYGMKRLDAQEMARAALPT